MKQWIKILDEIQDYYQEIYENEGVNIWFRGQCDSSWTLQSSLHRFVENGYKEIQRVFDEEEAVEMLWAQYKTLYRDYKAKAWNLLEHQERSAWGIIFSMRNHGIPTVLLDWTKSFIIALYFANYERDPKKDATIFVLHPPRLNKESINQEHLISLEEGFHDKSVVNLNKYHPHFKNNVQEKRTALAVTPVLTNQRMAVQDSNYILCGDSFTPLEEQYKNCVKKFILPSCTFEDSQKYLNLNGINHFMLFPDLFGLSVELNKELKKQIQLVKKKIISDTEN